MGLVSGAAGVQAAHELVDEDVHRPTVSNDVMQGQQQHMFIRSQLQQRGPQQRALLQVERQAGFTGDFLTGPPQALFGIQGGQVDMANPHLCTLSHTLQGLAVDFLEGGAQALVALHQIGKGQVQRLAVEAA